MNRCALVTGGGHGIGRAIVLKLAQEGYDVCVNYRASREAAYEVCALAEKCGVHAIPCKGDVRSVEEIRRMFETFERAFGGVDLLVNNAGVTKYLPLLEATEELWDEVTQTDWKGAYFCTQQAARNMIAHEKKGCVINITSVHQEFNFPIANVYGPTKAALAKFTKHAALELAEYGIRVNAVAPGFTLIIDDYESTPRGKRVTSRLPFHRYARPGEIADAVAFLASEKAGYVTGTCLLVDGGALLPTLTENQYV